MEKFKSNKKTGKTTTGQQADQIDISPEIEEKPIKEEAEETHHVMVGGFSPFTIGHNAVAKELQKSGGKAHIYTTQSTKRPISADKKVEYIKKAVGKGVSVHSTISPHHAFSHLYQSGARGNVVYHGGSDRTEIADRLAQYNGKEGKHGYYNFKSIKFKQTGGERKEGAKGIAGVSGSLARKAKSPEELKKYLPKALHPHAAEIHKQINEDTIFEAVLDIAARRKRAIAMKRREPRLQRQKVLALKRFASDLKLKRRAQNVARNLVRTRVAGKRGANYKNLSVSDKIAVDRMIQGKEKLIRALAKKMYQRVRKREMERVAKVRSGDTQQPSKVSVVAHTEHLPNKDFNTLFENIICSKYNIDSKQLSNLIEKSSDTGIGFLDLLEQYKSGASSWTNSSKNSPQQLGFNKVNSFIAYVKEGLKDPKDNPCWTGYKPVGTKKKNGKVVPNCVPEGKNEDDIESADYRITPSGRKVRAKEIIFKKDVEEQRSLEESFVMDRAAGIGVTYTAKDLGMQTQGAFAYHPSVIAMMQDMEENFMDGKNPEDKGDMSRLGLKGKSISQLKKIRSNENESKRRRQLAHWYINMHGD